MKNIVSIVEKYDGLMKVDLESNKFTVDILLYQAVDWEFEEIG
jgi:ribosomal protein S17E